MSIKVIPVVGEKTVIQARDSQPVEFAVDIADGSITRSENNLEITLSNGTEIFIEDFFVVAEEDTLPPLILADGSEVEAAEFLKAMNPDMDLTTAAGPSASPLSSGTSYSDDGGALIGGLDRLGDLDGFLFNSIREPAGQIDFFQPTIALDAGGATPIPENPLTPEVPDEPEGSEPPRFTFLRVGLMKVGLEDQNGNVHDPRVELDVNLLTSANNPSVSINLDANSQYSVVHDPVTGKIIFELKDPALANVPPSETVELVIDGKTYITQVASTAGSEMDEITTWPPLNEAVADLKMAWGGLTNGHQTGETLETPDGYEDTELHLQMRDSSLGNSFFELEKGSLYISNEGGVNSPDITYSHNKHVSLDHIDDGLKPAATVQYDSNLTATAYALGPDASTDITVKEGSVSLEANMSTIDSDSTSTISGVFAGDGATSSVDADTISVRASSGGIVNGGAGQDASVSAVRADGAHITYTLVENYWGENYYQENNRENAKVELTSTDDINLNVTALEGGDHSSVTYAAVAATDNGHVKINAGGEVNITATDTTATDAAGVYGIFAGYGMGTKDLLTPDDFRVYDGDYDYSYYSNALGALAGQYNEVRREWGDNGYELTHKVSEVSINSKDNVSVKVDLGENDTAGSASGIKLSFGDVYITSADNIDVGLTHSGVHGGGDKNFLSAVDVTHGYFTMDAEGDVKFDLKANGTNLAVLNSDRSEFESYNHYGTKDTVISAKNIEFSGTAGADHTSAVNHILGIRAFGKKETFAIEAEEKFSIDVTAYNNDGVTSSMGIHALGFDSSYNHFILSVNAPEFEINAHVLDGAGVDSQATGIRLENGISFGLGLFPYDDYHTEMGTRIDYLSMNVGGGLVNTGIELVTPPDESRSDGDTNASIFAEKFDMSVIGDTDASNESASYGVRMYRDDSVNIHKNTARTTLKTSELNLTVEDQHHSVGLQADGFGTSIKITSETPSYEGEHTALTVRISCKNFSAEDLKGIAIEAIDHGKVDILGSTSQAHSDFIQIDGHITAWSQVPSFPSLVNIKTGLGNDHIEINGNISDKALPTGHEHLPTANIVIDAGAGNDSVILNGKIDTHTSNSPMEEKWSSGGSYYEGESGFYLSGGEGHDILILKADSAEQFVDYYGDWLKGVKDGDLSHLSFESIMIQGLTADEAATNPAFSELYSLFQNSGADVQYYGSDVDVTFANLATLDKVDFDSFGGTDNDLLYVRVNEGDSLSDLKGLFSGGDGSLTGAEGLTLDLVDFENDVNLDGQALNSLLESLRSNDSNKNADVFLRFDDGDTNIPDNLTDAGWEAQGTTANVNGQEYTVYTNSQNDELGDLYVQLITTNS